MGALLDQFRSAGVVLSRLPDGRIHARGVLTDALRDNLRSRKPELLAELAANDGSHEEAELRQLVDLVSADWPPDERAEALTAALADLESALTCFRALAADLEPHETPAPLDPDMRTCRQCANLQRSGHCHAVLCGKSLGWGLATHREHLPSPDLPLRCAAYEPLPGDPDRRPGAKRWPFLCREHWTIPAVSARSKGDRGNNR